MTIAVSRAAAGAYLERQGDTHLPLRAALTYDPVVALAGVERGGALSAVALTVAPDAAIPGARPLVMAAADDRGALDALLDAGGWPAPAVWAAARPDLRDALAVRLGAAPSPGRGVICYVADAPQAMGGEPAPHRPPSIAHRQVTVRRLALDDADALDLAPCSLSPTALLGWLRRGWRAFGAVRDGALLCHALAAYPLGDTEEIAAVYTAPAERRRGLASAVVAAVAADIAGRALRPVYVASRNNLASQRVAQGLGMRRVAETWEIAQ